MTAARLNYELTGDAGAPPLLLVGSLGTTMRMWDPQMPAARQHFRVLRAEPRGHGGSEVRRGPYTIDELSHDVLALLDLLRIDRISYCGLSLGGMIGMWVAASAPDRIDRLALCCTSAWLPPAQAWTSRAAQVRAHGTASISEQVVGRWFTTAFRESDPATARWAADMLSTAPAEGYAGCCEAIAAMDLRAALSSITAATLVIAGSADPATPPAHGKTIAASVPGAELHLVQAAHLANIEAAPAVTALLMRHLTG